MGAGQTVFVCYETKQRKERKVIDQSRSVAEEKQVKKKKDVPESTAEAGIVVDPAADVEKRKAKANDDALTGEQKRRKRRRDEAKLAKQHAETCEDMSTATVAGVSAARSGDKKKRKKDRPTSGM